MLITSIRFTSGFVIKMLVGLHWMPNDVHRALSGAAGPHFHCHNMCTMVLHESVFSWTCNLQPMGGNGILL